MVNNVRTGTLYVKGGHKRALFRCLLCPENVDRRLSDMKASKGFLCKSCKLKNAKRVRTALEVAYNKTKVIVDLGTRGTHGARYATFKCKFCGVNFDSNVQSVKKGKTISCGCYKHSLDLVRNKTHGDSNRDSKYNKIYRAYHAMKSRCYNKNNKHYRLYGGVGVFVCDEWLNDYGAFKEWSILNGWQPSLEIDKDILSKKVVCYSPSTCSWVTHQENMLHRETKIGVTNIKYVTQDKRKKKKKFFGQRKIGNKMIRTKYYLTAGEAEKSLKNQIAEAVEVLK